MSHAYEVVVPHLDCRICLLGMEIGNRVLCTYIVASADSRLVLH